MRDWMRTITLAEVEAALDHVKETAGDVVPTQCRYVDEANEPHCAVGRALACLDVRLPVWRHRDPADKSDDPNTASIGILAKMMDLRIDQEALQLLGYVQDVNDENVGQDGHEVLALAEIIDEGRSKYAPVASYGFR